MPYRLPTDHERRMLYAWLKQASSLTAWRRLFAVQQTFVDLVELAHKESEQRRSEGAPSSSVSTDMFSSVVAAHQAFRVALDDLRRGERRCFLFRYGARGYFSEGLREANWWLDMWGGVMMNRNGFNPMDSPMWPELERALKDISRARREIDVVLQTRFTDVPAPVRAIDDYKSLQTYLAPFDAERPPDVPVIEPAVLKETGSVIPCFGIWEPVVVEYKRGFLGLYRDAIRTRGDVYPVDGCMNYLHGGSPAPTIDFPEDNVRNNGRPTTWRLIYKDERYGKHPVPDEEQRYAFNVPHALSGP